ncbi:type II toxin-antitoxin system HipA family toxin [Pseudomonas sp. NA-150]|uniref:type II toxin-antitoxin system HipA family toxin n=1 Tax=Pseudomonas sp. NA-150 TaxID=3367525 RepID=UPI0037CC1AEA
MSSAYIYMECPLTRQVLTLGKLTLNKGEGTFVYSPEAVEGSFWVPDPIRFPLTDKPMKILKNEGVPGFIDDAMPDGWGERVLRRTQKGDLSKVDLLLKSPNDDRAGNLMAGVDRTPREGIGQRPVTELRASRVDRFIDVCEVIYDSQLGEKELEAFKVRDQRSAMGGARPKRSFRTDNKMILAKPKDKYDDYDLPSIEHACMTFAASKGLSVANTALHKGEKVNTLLVERFDRTWDQDTGHFRRVPMLSGLTLLDAEWKAKTHPDWIYAALADELLRRGAPEADRRELFTRMAYNALVGNGDDHPRNHAVIWKGDTWRLSPLYDVLPILGEGPAQALSMAVGTDGPRITRDNLLSQHRHFALTREEAEAALNQVASWETELHEHYSQFLVGADLDAAVAAASGKRFRN